MAREQHAHEGEGPSSLPAILCLHGYGTNAGILRYQLRLITKSLANTFRFVFIEAPFEVQNPGPGAMPTFADARPFRRWHSDKTLASIFGVSAETLRNERRQVRELLQTTLGNEKSQEGGGPGVVGVMAFSQGAGLAAALCLDAELGKDIIFAVIFSALYPAVSLAENEITDPDPVLIRIPSIHVQGTCDTWRAQGNKVLEEYFAPEKVKRIEFKIGHEVPSKPREAAAVVDEVMTIWKSVSQEELLDFDRQESTPGGIQIEIEEHK